MFFKKVQSAPEAIVCGLGNPGAKYELTRHNAGFMAIDALARAQAVRVDRAKFGALCADADIGGRRVLILKPQTFMNESGRAVRQAADFYKIAPENIFVVSDDVSLPVGRMRVRASGSAGGHNGIKSIIAELGCDTFPRLKLGIGEPKFPELADWVLSRFDPAELLIMNRVYPAAADAVRFLLSEGTESAANRFNGMVIE